MMERFTKKTKEPDLWKYRVLTCKDYRVSQNDNGKMEFCGKFINKLGEYEDAEENGLLFRSPCKVGQVLFIDTNTLPTDKMKFDDIIPAFQKAIVVSIRINSKGIFIKVGVEANFLEEWIDNETGPDCDYFKKIKYYTYPKSAFGKTIFLTMEEAEKALEEKRPDDGQRTQSN